MAKIAMTAAAGSSVKAPLTQVTRWVVTVEMASKSQAK